ncbi:MAG TPA: hypothetical protein PLV68_17935, partial [Ilumatobacteraceae bacterium]|nr:hypothetical protein [Ilumatobacteraceae bacterium]
SYGLYLYHWPVYQIIRKNGFGLSWWKFLLAMAITLPITEASYRFVETPIRQHGWLGWRKLIQRSIRDTVRHRRRVLGALAAGSLAVGFAGMSVAVADNRCVGDVECSIEVGEALQQADTPP